MATYKDQGNDEFKAGNWLKAAALYSKGLKEDPQNAILLSNRSAALLKLNKVQKALADAEQCIECRKDWEKGYFRKACILESIQKFDQALEAYQDAARCNPDSKEVASKVKALGRRVRTPASQNGSSHRQNGSNGTISTSQAYEAAKVTTAKGEDIPRSAERTEDFSQRILDQVGEEIQKRTFDRNFPAVFFLPGRLEKTGDERMGQVSIQAAFDSPDTLANATEYLRQYAQDSGSQAAVAVVPKHKIAYPQVWQKSAWPHGKTDGIFVQLEAPGTRKVWFVPLGQKVRDPLPVKEKFSIVEALFR